MAYRIEITGITHSWRKWETYETYQEACESKAKAIKAGRKANTIRIVREKERKTELNRIYKDDYAECSDCGGLVAEHANWLGEQNRIGYYEVVYYCTECFKWIRTVEEE